MRNEPPWKELLLLAMALAFLVFLFPLAVKFPLFDPDEGLHASIAQEMVEGGDWLVPHFLGKPFLDKPILYFWCEAISLKCFGMNELAVRLPGLLLGLLGSITTGIVGYRMFGRTTGLVSFIFYSTMIFPVTLAQAAVHDVALVPCVNLAILLFWLSDRAQSWKSSAAFALAIGSILGIAILAKGLLGVAMVGVAYGGYLLLTRQFTLAACYRGAAALLIAAAIAALWYLAVERRQPGFLHYYFIERHVLGFATATQKHGDASWWLYLPVLLLGGLPWIGYLPVTIRELVETNTVPCPRLSWACWKRSKKPNMPTTSVGMAPGMAPSLSLNTSTCLLSCWLLGGTLLLSLAQSKLLTYLWPVFPPVAILAAIGWARLLEGTLSPEAKRMLCRSFLFSSYLGPFALPILLFIVQKVEGIQFGWPVWVAAVIIALGAFTPLICYFLSRWFTVLVASTLAITAHFLAILCLIVPPVAEQHSEKQLAEYFNSRWTGFHFVEKSHPVARQFGNLSYESGGLPMRLIFVEERIGSFVFYLDPALRASITEDRLHEIRRPKNPPPQKMIFQPGDVVVVPEKGLRRAEEYVDLKNRNSCQVGRYRLFSCP
jgi:4-amino-4-deoxy-L-arabinose transferase-like glycosyltransferase